MYENTLLMGRPSSTSMRCRTVAQGTGSVRSKHFWNSCTYSTHHRKCWHAWQMCSVCAVSRSASASPIPCSALVP